MRAGEGTAMRGLRPGAMFKVVMRRAHARGAAIAGGATPARARMPPGGPDAEGWRQPAPLAALRGAPLRPAVTRCGRRAVRERIRAGVRVAVGRGAP